MPLQSDLDRVEASRGSSKMGQSRVFQIANEFGVDTLAVLDVLKVLGEEVDRPERRLSSETADAVRQVFKTRQAHRGAKTVSKSEPTKAKGRPTRMEQHERPAPGLPGKPKQDTAAKLKWNELQRRAVLAEIPATFTELKTALGHASLAEPVVISHDNEREQRYSVHTLSGDRIESLTGSQYQRVIAPLKTAHEWYRAKRRDAPNVFVAFDLDKGQAWFARKLATLQRMPLYERFDAMTFERVNAPSVPTTGEPPRLALKAHRIEVEYVPALKKSVSAMSDAPEEAFLLDEDFLRLAVDSLDGAGVITPLPVHLNALWVFSRPIIMQRSDGSDRHVRAVWYREGAAMWRMRAYVSGKHGSARQVGDQVSGRVPFVAVWDETHPEQKLLAAIWALMSQGGITDSESVERRRGVGTEHDHGNLTIVRVKAGTEHAAAYGDEQGKGSPHRVTYSVRGHWRQQPYRSLGVDDEGRVRTRPIWIASYTKGEVADSAAEKKVIVVRS